MVKSIKKKKIEFIICCEFSYGSNGLDSLQPAHALQTFGAVRRKFFFLLLSNYICQIIICKTLV